MIVLDASVLIGYLDAEDAQHEDATGILLSLADDRLGVCVITLAEVLVAPTRGGRAQRTITTLGLLQIDELPLPADAARQLAHLRVETRLRLPDCCVLLTAREHDAAVATLDRRLASAATALGLDTVAGG